MVCLTGAAVAVVSGGGVGVAAKSGVGEGALPCSKGCGTGEYCVCGAGG